MIAVPLGHRNLPRHDISISDAPAKAAGLAKFAAKHADKFGRIELILIDKTSSKKFDLTDETVRNKLVQVETKASEVVDNSKKSSKVSKEELRVARVLLDW